MPVWFDSIPDHTKKFILQQPVFFVSSAPLGGEHVNVSPKGGPSRTFAVLGPNQVAYIDSSGSGVETISHIYENGRVTLMWCSFLDTPRIIRLFCRGRVIERDSPEFRPFIRKMAAAGMTIESPEKKYHEAVLEEFAARDAGDKDATTGRKKGRPADVDLNPDDGAGVVGARAVIVLDVIRGHSSCGYGVPLLTMSPDGSSLAEGSKEVTATTPSQQQQQQQQQQQEEALCPPPRQQQRSQDIYSARGKQFDEHWDDRSMLFNAVIKKTRINKLLEYRREKNVKSLDGLPGLRLAYPSWGRYAAVRARYWLRRTFVWQRQALLVGFLLALLLQLQLLAVFFYLFDGRFSFAFDTEGSDATAPSRSVRWLNRSSLFREL